MTSDGQDWRLEARLSGAGAVGHSEHHRHASAAGLADRVRVEVGDDVVVTHDGPVLFAYGATHENVDAVREQVAAALEHDGLRATLHVSHWDHDLDDWRQVEPPLSAAGEHAEDDAARNAATPDTRTFVSVAGRLVRAQVEQIMLKSARIHGIECQIAEHPRLLTTQLSFTVTGPAEKLEEFRQDLRAAALATIRADAWTMNPVA